MTAKKTEWADKYLDRKTVGLIVAGFLLIYAGETWIELRRTLKKAKQAEAAE